MSISKVSDDVSSDPTRLFTLLDGLIDRWCERRALGPLRALLPVYPPAPVHTDQWAHLYAAVHALRRSLDPLPAEEGAAVAEAHAALYQLLKQTAAGRGILDTAG